MFISNQCIKLTALTILTVGAAASSLAQRPGDLVITPTRVVLEDRSRSGDLTLLNRGAKPIRYRLSLVNMEMSQDGILSRKDTDDPLSAVSSLRLSPREIVLEPGISQRIRIAATTSAGQQDGELRAHLVFEPMTMPNSAQNNSDGTPALRINLEFRSVVSIPVIVRHGMVAATATLSDALVEKDTHGWIARFTVHRAGNRSVRGNVTATFIPLSGGNKVEIGQIAGLSVYCPNQDRVVNLKLAADLAKLGPGKVVIRFAEPEHSRGANDVQTQVNLPG